MLTAQRLLAAIQEAAPLRRVVQLYIRLQLERSGCRPRAAAAVLGISTRGVYNHLCAMKIQAQSLRPEEAADVETALLAVMRVVRPWPVSVAQVAAQLLLLERDAERHLDALVTRGQLVANSSSTGTTGRLLYAVKEGRR